MSDLFNVSYYIVTLSSFFCFFGHLLFSFFDFFSKSFGKLLKADSVNSCRLDNNINAKEFESNNLYNYFDSCFFLNKFKMSFKLRRKHSFYNNHFENETNSNDVSHSMLIYPTTKTKKCLDIDSRLNEKDSEQESNKHILFSKKKNHSYSTNFPPATNSQLSRSNSNSVSRLSQKASKFLSRSASTSSIFMTKTKQRSPDDNVLKQLKSAQITISSPIQSKYLENEKPVRHLKNPKMGNTAGSHLSKTPRNEADVPDDAQTLAYSHCQSHIVAQKLSKPAGLLMTTEPSSSSSFSSWSSSSIISSSASARTGLSTSITSAPRSSASRSNPNAANAPCLRYYPTDASLRKLSRPTSVVDSKSLSKTGTVYSGGSTTTTSTSSITTTTVPENKPITVQNLSPNVNVPKQVSFSLAKELRSNHCDDRRPANKPYRLSTEEPLTADSRLLATSHTGSNGKENIPPGTLPTRFKHVKSLSTPALLASCQLQKEMLSSTGGASNRASYIYDSENPANKSTKKPNEKTPLKVKNLVYVPKRINSEMGSLAKSEQGLVPNRNALELRIDNKAAKASYSEAKKDNNGLAANARSKLKQSYTRSMMNNPNSIGHFYNSYEFSTQMAQLNKQKNNDLVPPAVASRFRCAREIASVSSFAESNGYGEEETKTKVFEDLQSNILQKNIEEEDNPSIGSYNDDTLGFTSSSEQTSPETSGVGNVECSQPTINVNGLFNGNLGSKVETNVGNTRERNKRMNDTNPKVERLSGRSSIDVPKRSRKSKFTDTDNGKTIDYCRNKAVRVFSVQTATVANNLISGSDRIYDPLAAETASIISCSTQNSCSCAVPESFSNQPPNLQLLIPNQQPSRIEAFLTQISHKDSKSKPDCDSNILVSNLPRMITRSVTDPELMSKTTFQDENHLTTTQTLMQSASPLETLAVHALNQQRAMAKSKSKKVSSANNASESVTVSKSSEKKAKKNGLKKKRLPNEFVTGSSSDEFPTLAANGLYAFDVTGDGNCLFRALSDQYYGDGGSGHRKIRAMTMDYMENNPGEFEMFMLDENLAQHITRMRKDGTFGDQAEIVAFARTTNVNISIHQRDTEPLLIRPDGGSCETKYNGSEPSQTLHIAYHYWEHYSSVRNIGGPYTGPPQIQVQLSAVAGDYIQNESEPVVMTKRAARKKAREDENVQLIMDSLPFTVSENVVRSQLNDRFGGNLDSTLEYMLCNEEEYSSIPNDQRIMSALPLQSNDGSEKSGHKKTSSRSKHERRKSNVAMDITLVPSVTNKVNTSLEAHNSLNTENSAEADQSIKSINSSRRLSLMSSDLEKPLPPLPQGTHKKRHSLKFDPTSSPKSVKFSDIVVVSTGEKSMLSSGHYYEKPQEGAAPMIHFETPTTGKLPTPQAHTVTKALESTNQLMGDSGSSKDTSTDVQLQVPPRSSSLGRSLELHGDHNSRGTRENAIGQTIDVPGSKNDKQFIDNPTNVTIETVIDPPAGSALSSKEDELETAVRPKKEGSNKTGKRSSAREKKEKQKAEAAARKREKRKMERLAMHRPELNDSGSNKNNSNADGGSSTIKVLAV